MDPRYGRLGALSGREHRPVVAAAPDRRRLRRRPRRLALLLDGESWPRLSARLVPGLAARVGAVLADAPTMGEHRTDDETYFGLDAGLVVEVLAGSGGHGTVTVVRIR